MLTKYGTDTFELYYDLLCDAGNKADEVVGGAARVIQIWASCHIRKIAGCACTENAGNIFPATAG